MSWEERYQTGDTPWDKGAPAPPLLDLLTSHPTVFGAGQILVPGCGLGHDARAIARALPQNTIIGLDLSATALNRAKELDTRNTVQFALNDFLTLTPEAYPNLQAIFEHTCFCAIPPTDRPAYASACARLLPTGAYWIAIIFLTPRPEDDPTLGPPFQSSVPELHDLFDDAFTLIDSFPPPRTYKGREGKELVMIWQRK